MKKQFNSKCEHYDRFVSFRTGVEYDFFKDCVFISIKETEQNHHKWVCLYPNEIDELIEFLKSIKDDN